MSTSNEPEVVRVKRDPSRPRKEAPRIPAPQPEKPSKTKEIVVEPNGQASSGKMRCTLGAIMRRRYGWLLSTDSRHDAEQILELVLFSHGYRDDAESITAANRHLTQEMYWLLKSEGMRRGNKGGWIRREYSGDAPDKALAYQNSTAAAWSSM